VLGRFVAALALAIHEDAAGTSGSASTGRPILPAFITGGEPAGTMVIRGIGDDPVAELVNGLQVFRLLRFFVEGEERKHRPSHVAG